MCIIFKIQYPHIFNRMYFGRFFLLWSFVLFRFLFIFSPVNMHRIFHGPAQQPKAPINPEKDHFYLFLFAINPEFFFIFAYYFPEDTKCLSLWTNCIFLEPAQNLVKICMKYKKSKRNQILEDSHFWICFAFFAKVVVCRCGCAFWLFCGEMVGWWNFAQNMHHISII